MSLLTSIAKLRGRENYVEWKFSMTNYLAHEDLWGCIDETDKDAKKITKTKSKLILSIEPYNYVHVQSCATAAEVWKALENAFQDNGLVRKVGLLKKLIEIKLVNFPNVEQFISEIMQTVQKLRNIKFEIPDEWVGVLMLAGLPQEYKPMIMGLESSGIAITADSIKSKLINEVYVDSESKSKEAEQQAMAANSQDQKASKYRFKCYKCGGFGHIARDCKKDKNSDKKKEKKKDKTMLCCLTGKLDSSEKWYLDSGATTHMTGSRRMFQSLEMSNTGRTVLVANNNRMCVEGVGDVRLSLGTYDNKQAVVLKDVLYIPDCCVNLLSISTVIKNGYKVIFQGESCTISDSDGLFAVAKMEDGMFVLQSSAEKSFNCKEINESELWHKRMGHLNENSLQKLKKSQAKGVNFPDEQHSIQDCEICVLGKHPKSPFQHEGSRADESLEIIHSDVCGPMNVNSIGGARYIVTFIDDFTRRVAVYNIKYKSQVLEKFKEFKNLSENQLQKKIKKLRTDNGGEYCSDEFDKYLKEAGIIHQKSCPYTPEQNGLAERMNRTIIEKTRCLLAEAGLPQDFWAEAVSTACYLINRSPCQNSLSVTPEQAWTGKIPNLKHLKIFGCKVMVHIPKDKRRKLDVKSRECIFLGYCDNTKGYRCYNPEDKMTYISRNVKFFEKIYPGLNHSEKSDVIHFFQDEPEDSAEASSSGLVQQEGEVNSAISVSIEEVQDDDISVQTEVNHNISRDEEFFSGEDEQEAPINEPELRRSTRISKPPERLQCQISSEHVDNDPSTVEEALSSPEAHLWKEAMQEEYDSLMENRTWDLVDKPKSKKPISCKWVFKKKRTSTGEIERYKARLVVKGYSQKYGIDYEETFSPVVRYTTVRYLMGLAVKFNLEIEQMDAVTAFLQGELSEEIYMEQPQGFNSNNQVCRLRKSLYGLKQASRVWNEKLDKALKRFGLTQSNVDSCLYYHIEGDRIFIVAIYVDDLLILHNDLKRRDNFKKNLMNTFKMKDIGNAEYVLGIKITRDREKGKIWLDQKLYIENLLEKYNMTECNPVSTPTDPNQKLLKNDSKVISEDMANVPYQQAVGSLLYAAQVTRPDIAYAVNYCSRFSRNPDKSHWTAVKRIMRYLKGTLDFKIEFNRHENSTICGFTDSDWAGDLNDRRSTCGYIFTMCGGPISWNSKKQQTVALSTTEAEYMGVTHAAQEGMWLKKLNNQLFKDKNAINIKCDNKSAINLCSNKAYHPRTKHIDIKHYFIQEKVNDGIIKLEYISTKQMLADFLTKGLTFEKHRSCLGGLNIHS